MKALDEAKSVAAENQKLEREAAKQGRRLAAEERRRPDFGSSAAFVAEVVEIGKEMTDEEAEVYGPVLGASVVRPDEEAIERLRVWLLAKGAR